MLQQEFPAYRIQDPERGIVGPVSHETVLDLLRAGVVSAAARVARDKGPFQPLAELSELALASGAQNEAPNATWDVAQQPALRLLFDLHRRRTSGLLVARNGELRKDIYLHAGDIIFLSSNIPSERFGQYLVRRGRLDPHDLAVALDSMHTEDHRFGETLLRLGLLDRKELAEELRAHHLERLADLCSWVTGRCELFAKRERGNDDELEVRLPVPTLLLGAVRAMPETRLAALVERYREHLPMLTAPDATESFAFTELEWRVVDKLNGQSSVDEIVAAYPSGSHARQATQAALYLLLALDLVKLDTPAAG